MRVRAGLGERRTLSLDSRWMAACRHRELKLPVTRPTRPTPGFNFLSHIFGIVQWYPKKLFQKNESRTRLRLQLQLAIEAVTVICTLVCKANSGPRRGLFPGPSGTLPATSILKDPLYIIDWMVPTNMELVSSLVCLVLECLFAWIAWPRQRVMRQVT
jgi:hypothetical protein